MKKVLMVLAGLMALFLAAIIIIPLVVDVDKYRPQIVQAANDNLNGKLELGKLKLSLWGKIHIGIDGMDLKDAHGQSIVAVKDASFTMPYTSILSGSPLITLAMTQPQINIVKNREGNLNVMMLMKGASPSHAGTAAKTATPTKEVSAPATATKAEEKSSAKSVALPALLVNARVGVFIENAKLVYKDEAMKLVNTVDELNFRVKDFSLSRSTEMELWADLKTTMDDLTIKGPLKLTAELSPEISGGEFKSATVVANFNADDLDIQKAKLFHKAKGDSAHFKFNGTLSQESLHLKEATARFHNAEITVSGDYHKVNGANVTFKSKTVDLKSWSDLIPMLKEYDLEGQLGISGYAKGQPEALIYQAELGVKNFSMKGPSLKAKPVINGEIVVGVNKIEKLNFDLRAPGNDIKLTSRMTSFTNPQLQLTLKSSGMDLDQLIDFGKSKKSASIASLITNAYAASEEDYDAMLESLRSNSMMKALVLDGSVGITMMKAMNVRVDDISAKLQFKNLIAAISDLSMKVFGGTIKGGFSTDLKPAHPNYNMKIAVNGLDMSKASESQFPSFKDTLTGKLTANIEGGGASFNADLAKKKLQMKGNFRLNDAKFKTIDIARIVNEALNSTVAKVGDKIPVLKGKKLAVNKDAESRYEIVSGNFTIQNGTLNAPDFMAKPAPKHGLELRGATKMGLVDESLDANWEVIDSQHMTGADQLNVDVGGHTVKNVLAKGDNDPVIMPIKVGCKWSAPCPNYSAVPEYLGGIALGRVAKGAGEAAKQKAMDEVKKRAGDQLGNGLKKLFGH